MFKVHIGYTPTGRNRYVYFDTLEAAKEYCSKAFRALSVVLSITKA